MTPTPRPNDRNGEHGSILMEYLLLVGLIGCTLLVYCYTHFYHFAENGTPDDRDGVGYGVLYKREVQKILTGISLPIP